MRTAIDTAETLTLDKPAAATEAAAGLALVVNARKRIAAIEDAGFEVVAARAAKDTLEIFARVTPKVVVVGTGRGDSSWTRGLRFVRELRQRFPGAAAPLVVLTKSRPPETIELAYAAGATDVWIDEAAQVVWKKRLTFVVNAARAFDELSRSSRKLERARRLARFASWEWNLATHKVSWSKELAYLLGRDLPERKIGLEAVLSMVEGCDRARVAEKIAEGIKDGRPFPFDHRSLRDDGSELVLHHEVDVVAGPSGEGVAVEAVVVDVTEIKKAELQIHSLANYDPLTGLPNRSSFLNLLENARARSERSGAATGIALLDMDRFKEVNESLGHAAGDELLRQVAGRLLSSVRKGDYVAREGTSFVSTVARQGGDEFLILLSDVDQAHHAALAARRVLEVLRRPFRIEGQEVFATASMGIAFARAAAMGTEELLRQAEIAMYSAKEQGRNAIQFFDESMNQAVVERFEVENALRRALARSELSLVYQPLVRARSREIVGVEALLRWQHPIRGLLSADEFVPLAEETGLIVAIGRWVLRTACEQLKAWRRAHLPALRLSVNVSPRELRAPGFVAGLAKVLEETETHPPHLELELTERGVMGNDRRVLDVVMRLKEIGVRLAVDDFGTGNTTFHYLKNFPLTTIKIDKSFTEAVARDPKDAAITKALLAMAHRLELNVVAEGVENEDQLSFLGANDCDEVQGYLFGRPIPAEELSSLLHR
jgi:diguanylate cyclase (GGDEF)-like protein